MPRAPGRPGVVSFGAALAARTQITCYTHHLRSRGTVDADEVEEYLQNTCMSCEQEVEREREEKTVCDPNTAKQRIGSGGKRQVPNYDIDRYDALLCTVRGIYSEDKKDAKETASGDTYALLQHCNY